MPLARLVPALLALALVVACAPTGGGRQAVASKDGLVEVTVPAGWRVDDYNKHAILEMRCDERNLHLMVFSLPRKDLPVDPETAFDRVRMGYGGRRVTARSPATEVEMGGLPGLRAEVCYRDEDDVAYTCMMTQVVGSDRVHQLFLRTSSQEWQKNVAEIQAIQDSFREVGGKG